MKHPEIKSYRIIRRLMYDSCEGSCVFPGLRNSTNNKVVEFLFLLWGYIMNELFDEHKKIFITFINNKSHHQSINDVGY